MTVNILAVYGTALRNVCNGGIITMITVLSCLILLVFFGGLFLAVLLLPFAFLSALFGKKTNKDKKSNSITFEEELEEEILNWELDDLENDRSEK